MIIYKDDSLTYKKNIEYLINQDPIMKQIIKSVGPFSLKIRSDPFLALVESIINQQLTTKAAQSIYNRFTTHYGNRFPSPSDVCSTPDYIMRSFGISAKKIEYIKNLSSDLIDGKLVINREFFSNTTNDYIINYLTKINGIGVWTAEMFMIFCLGRPDVFPLQDIGLKKSLRKWYFPTSKGYPNELQMKKISSKWKPFRTIATWYLWKSAATFESIG